MASSGSFARGDQPRSVPDDLKGPYEAMSRRQNAYNERQAQAGRSAPTSTRPLYVPDPEHALPDAITTTLVDTLGSARRAREKWVAGDQLGAGIEAALNGPDQYLSGAALKGLLKKGGFKFSGKFDWSAPPWKDPGVRKWLEQSGFVNPGEQAHHWAIPQNGWGKIVPNFIKNQPWNVKGMDAVPHRRTHGRAKVDGEWLPEFTGLEKLWNATPAYFKAAVAKGATDLAPQKRQTGQQRSPNAPRKDR